MKSTYRQRTRCAARKMFLKGHKTFVCIRSEGQRSGRWGRRINPTIARSGLKCVEAPTALGHNLGHNHLRLDSESRK